MVFTSGVIQFCSVQLLSRVWLFATPWIAAGQASLTITNSRSLLKIMSIESVMPSSHLILCCPRLLLLPIPPSIRVFSNESTLRVRWPKYWSFSFSIILSKEIPGLISFLKHVIPRADAYKINVYSNCCCHRGYWSKWVLSQALRIPFCKCTMFFFSFFLLLLQIVQQWPYPDSHYWNQIDYILCSRRWRSSQFSSVQSLSRVRVFVTPWIAAHQASLSIINSLSLLKLISIKSVMPSRHLILCRPLLLLPPIPPRIRVFSNESTLSMRWPKYWSFSLSISPSNEQPGLISFRMDCLDLLAVQGTLKSVLQHHSSKASILWHSAFFTVQLSHPYMIHRKNHSLD